MQIHFCGGAYIGRSTNIDSSRSVNFFMEFNPNQNAKTPNSLIGTPGSAAFATFPAATGRMIYNFAGRCFVISLSTLYELYSTGTLSAPLGTLLDSSGIVSVADNGVAASGVGGNQLLIISSGFGYIFNVLTNTFVQITDPGFPSNAQQVTFQDGYFIVTNSTMKVTSSALYDGMTWPGLAFAAVEATPDNVKNVVSVHQQLCFFKEVSTEIWQNSGVPTSQGFPFTRVQGAVVGYGTPAPRSVAKGADTVFFLANSRNGDFGEFAGVAMLQGYQAQIISPPSISYRISHMVFTDTFGYCFAYEGHIFYVLTFPTSDATFVYDVTTQMWHEWSTSNGTDSFVHRHLSNGYTYFAGRHLVLDFRNTLISQLSSSLYSDSGTNIESIRTAPIIYDPKELESVIIHRLVVDIESGVGDGTSTSNGSPVALLSWSKDSGHTWSSEYPGSMGKQGEYNIRLTWRKLGRSRNKVFRIRMSDSVKKVIVQAFINDGAMP